MQATSLASRLAAPKVPAPSRSPPPRRSLAKARSPVVCVWGKKPHKEAGMLPPGFQYLDTKITSLSTSLSMTLAASAITVAIAIVGGAWTISLDLRNMAVQQTALSGRLDGQSTQLAGQSTQLAGQSTQLAGQSTQLAALSSQLADLARDVKQLSEK